MEAVNECSARPLYRAPVSAIIPPPIHAAPLLLETARARSIERQPFLLNFFPCFPARFRKRPRIGRDDPFVDEVRQILLPIFTRISPEYLEDSRTLARNRNNDREIEFIRVIRSRISRVCLFPRDNTAAIYVGFERVEIGNY